MLGALKFRNFETVELCFFGILDTYNIESHDSLINQLSMVNGSWLMAQGRLAGAPAGLL